jgi:hypothetical protein
LLPAPNSAEAARPSGAEVPDHRADLRSLVIGDLSGLAQPPLLALLWDDPADPRTALSRHDGRQQTDNPGDSIRTIIMLATAVIDTITARWSAAALQAAQLFQQLCVV